MAYKKFASLSLHVGFKVIYTSWAIFDLTPLGGMSIEHHVS